MQAQDDMANSLGNPYPQVRERRRGWRLFHADDSIALRFADQLANSRQTNVRGGRAELLLQHGSTIFHQEGA